MLFTNSQRQTQHKKQGSVEVPNVIIKLIMFSSWTTNSLVVKLIIVKESIYVRIPESIITPRYLFSRCNQVDVVVSLGEFVMSSSDTND